MHASVEHRWPHRASRLGARRLLAAARDVNLSPVDRSQPSVISIPAVRRRRHHFLDSAAPAASATATSNAAAAAAAASAPEAAAAANCPAPIPPAGRT